MLNLLPDELIHQILIRSPSKSVCRIKAVSKRFNAIISDPSFVPRYVSGPFSPPSWLILDRIPKHDPESTYPTQFQLVDRPEISTSSINPLKLGFGVFMEPRPSRYPTSIVQSSNGLILFTSTIILNVDLPDDFPRYLLFCPLIEEVVLYVVNPITNEWARLPPSTNPICERFGFTAQVYPTTGVVGRFMVVQYRPVIGSDNAALMCFASDMGEWVELSANYMLNHHEWFTEWTFEFDGKLFWVDLAVGLITWDVKDNDYFQQVVSREVALCRFIPLLEGSMRLHVSSFALVKERWVGVGGGEFVQFIEVFNDSSLKLWKLKNCDSGGEEWSLMYEVSRENVRRVLTCERSCGGGGLPTPLFVLVPLFFHPFEADVVYFMMGDYFLWFNLCTLQVGDVHSFPPHEFVLPFVLPRWPSPIPKRMYTPCTPCDTLLVMSDGPCESMVKLVGSLLGVRAIWPTVVNLNEPD